VLRKRGLQKLARSKLLQKFFLLSWTWEFNVTTKEVTSYARDITRNSANNWSSNFLSLQM
jgi:hypothetical protein